MGTSQSADITSNLPFHFEVKRCERLQFRDWWSQLQSEATDKIGVLAFRWNGGPWIIAMGVDDWCDVVRESEFCCTSSASETKTKHENQNRQTGEKILHDNYPRNPASKTEEAGQKTRTTHERVRTKTNHRRIKI